MGVLAGFYGGLIDTLVSRMTEIVHGVPAASCSRSRWPATVGDRLDSYTLFGVFDPGVVTLVIVISVFSAGIYPARIVRAQVLSLREKEFVEAARMVGGSNYRIMRSHLLPAPGRHDHRLRHPARCDEHPVRGRPVVPRRRAAAAERKLGQPALGRRQLLHDRSRG